MIWTRLKKELCNFRNLRNRKLQFIKKFEYRFSTDIKRVGTTLLKKQNDSQNSLHEKSGHPFSLQKALFLVKLWEKENNAFNIYKKQTQDLLKLFAQNSYK